MKKLGLLPRILIAIVLGIAIGYVSPLWFAEIMATFNAIFSQFLGFMIPMIIVGFVTPAIADIGGRAGKLLVVTAAIAYFATFFAGLLSYFTGILTFPSLIGGEEGIALTESTPSIQPFFTIEMPPLMTVMTALVLAFMLGLGMAFLSGNALRRGFGEFRDIVSKTIDAAILPLLPIYIFGIFLNMTLEGQVGMILKCFMKIIVVIFILHVLILVIQYCVAALFAKKNPFWMLRTMMPAYFTALGTQSSAATIPVTLRQAIKMGVSEDIAGFVVPLCATIHMSGSTLKIVACALALMIMHNQPHDLGLFCHFIGMLGITIIAAPGIPGGAIMASIGLLQSILGFDEQMVALMIALYIAMDSFGTACNVTGDGALAAIIDRLFSKKTPAKPTAETSNL
ncbi:MAG: dicarboxylate/amino acid:cation symporter [Duncaniella sp.]|uniref:dicarboxylate/amino acid:cation symporter n=1 Tax=Duncaniella sp. TaxID=2518496 RepID=UPI0023BF146C|nr:dicarboxylate/amino acid:cation symporter [Duncaniella sp.]MDE6089643.1 dicarboxylate/amino acid:cation symporter [Duncaniella sp.]